MPTPTGNKRYARFISNFASKAGEKVSHEPLPDSDAEADSTEADSIDVLFVLDTFRSFSCIFIDFC